MDLDKGSSEAAVAFGPLPRPQSPRPEESGATSPRSHSPRPRSNEAGPSRSTPPLGFEEPRRTASPTNFTRATEADDNHVSRSLGSQHKSLPPSPAAPRSAEGPRGSDRPRTFDTMQSYQSRKSHLDYVIPLDLSQRKEMHREKTVGERLKPTLEAAKKERLNYAMKAKMTGYALNVAIGLQVLLGAMTTALSAVTSGHQTSVTVSVLGGLSTLVASYLARARGSGEPELSILRVKDLDQYIRECEAFTLDFGHLEGREYDKQLSEFRDKFEQLLGNGNGERRIAAPPV